MKNRWLSFALVAFVYLLASAVGVISCIYLPLPTWLALLVADVIATIVVFAFSVIFNNASVYDPYWSIQPIVILVAFAISSQMSILKICILAVVCLWGVRLTANWAYTFKNMTHQDWRYTMLKEKTKKIYPLINLLGIHLFPTLVVYACTLPAVMLFESGVQGSLWGLAPLAVSVFAVILQGVADCQMHKFKKKKEGGVFIRDGLWKYSRHPNYLGEILMWWGVGIACVVGLGGQWYLLAGALINTIMFLVVSIPMADKRQSAKKGFGEYKKQTRMLLPIKKFRLRKKK